MALIDVVKFDGLKSRDWLIYKHPSEELVLGTQLVVQEGQAAIFVKGGAVADVFLPGTHTLSTQNLPILHRLVNLPFGGNTPFTAEIYFFNTTAMLDINWGTTDPIQLIDPKYAVKLRIRAFGQMGLRVSDVSCVFKELIGGMQKSDLVKVDKIKEYFRGILVLKVKSAIADTIINNGISALEITAKLDDLSESVKADIALEFDKFGFAVVNFFIQSINFPDEDFDRINSILEDKAAFDIMGDARYATKRTFDVYESAANNENGVAGAFVAGGMGMGVGMGMGASMGQSFAAGPMGQPNPMNPYPMAGAAGPSYCRSCHAQIPAGSKFCPFCGANNSANICACGKELAPGANFCTYCGRKVN